MPEHGVCRIKTGNGVLEYHLRPVRALYLASVSDQSGYGLGESSLSAARGTDKTYDLVGEDIDIDSAYDIPSGFISRAYIPAGQDGTSGVVDVGPLKIEFGRIEPGVGEELCRISITGA